MKYNILILLGFVPLFIQAQLAEIDSNRFIPEFKYTWNNNKQYIKFTAVNQIWVRHSDMNPGTEIDNHPVTNYTDIGIRRLRISALAQLTNRLFFYTQFGQNNFNFLSKRNKCKKLLIIFSSIIGITISSLCKFPISPYSQSGL